MNNYQVPLFFLCCLSFAVGIINSMSAWCTTTSTPYSIAVSCYPDGTRALVTTTLNHGALNPVCSPGREGHQGLISYKMCGAWGKAKNETFA